VLACFFMMNFHFYHKNERKRYHTILKSKTLDKSFKN